MLDRTYNAVVRYMLATTAEEVFDVFARLSNAVVDGLAAELDVAGDVHRYDREAKRAYYFEREGTNLAVWSWDEVHYFHEAGELLAIVVALKVPLDEAQANKAYARATGRTVENPRALTNELDMNPDGAGRLGLDF